MDLTRRRFLGSAASAVALMLPLDVAHLERRRASLARDDTVCAGGRDATACIVLDLEGACAFPESLAGYESASGTERLSRSRAAADGLPACALLIVPAAMEISESVARSIAGALRDGTTVILESGAVFTSAESREFDAHRTALREHLGVHVGTPVSLWPRPAGPRGLPYVRYSWPVTAHVRDFSRVLPIESLSPDDEVFATVDGLPVALRHRVGRGTLLFLGSPLGPALRAGDAEARSWLAALLRAVE